jgi:hypothetical protein
MTMETAFILEVRILTRTVMASDGIVTLQVKKIWSKVDR